MNKKVTILKAGKTRHYVVRQLAHDRPVRVGGKLFGGVIVAIEVL